MVRGSKIGPHFTRYDTTFSIGQTRDTEHKARTEIITVTSHERLGVSSNGKLGCFFSGLSRLKTKLYITGAL